MGRGGDAPQGLGGGGRALGGDALSVPEHASGWVRGAEALLTGSTGRCGGVAEEAVGCFGPALHAPGEVAAGSGRRRSSVGRRCAQRSPSMRRGGCAVPRRCCNRVDWTRRRSWPGRRSGAFPIGPAATCTGARWRCVAGRGRRRSSAGRRCAQRFPSMRRGGCAVPRRCCNRVDWTRRRSWPAVRFPGGRVQAAIPNRPCDGGVSRACRGYIRGAEALVHLRVWTRDPVGSSSAAVRFPRAPRGAVRRCPRGGGGRALGGDALSVPRACVGVGARCRGVVATGSTGRGGGAGRGGGSVARCRCAARHGRLLRQRWVAKRSAVPEHGGVGARRRRRCCNRVRLHESDAQLTAAARGGVVRRAVRRVPSVAWWRCAGGVGGGGRALGGDAPRFPHASGWVRCRGDVASGSLGGLAEAPAVRRRRRCWCTGRCVAGRGRWRSSVGRRCAQRFPSMRRGGCAVPRRCCNRADWTRRRSWPVRRWCVSPNLGGYVPRRRMRRGGERWCRSLGTLRNAFPGPASGWVRCPRVRSLQEGRLDERKRTGEAELVSPVRRQRASAPMRGSGWSRSSDWAALAPRFPSMRRDTVPILARAGRGGV